MCWRLVATIDYPPLNNIVPRLDNSEVAEISDPWCSEVPQYSCKNVCGVSPRAGCLLTTCVSLWDNDHDNLTLLCACCSTVRGGVVAWSPCWYQQLDPPFHITTSNL